MALYITQTNQDQNDKEGIALDLGQFTLLITPDPASIFETPNVSQNIKQLPLTNPNRPISRS